MPPVVPPHHRSDGGATGSARGHCLADLGSVLGSLLVTNAGRGSSWEGIEGESQRVVGDGSFLECPVSCPGCVPE